MTRVSAHTRNGKPVRSHSRDDGAGRQPEQRTGHERQMFPLSDNDQAKRDRFRKRSGRERETGKGTGGRPPGERKPASRRRKSRGGKTWRKIRRRWNNHKKASAFAAGARSAGSWYVGRFWSQAP